MKKKLLIMFLIVCMMLTFIPMGTLAMTVNGEEITPNPDPLNSVVFTSDAGDNNLSKLANPTELRWDGTTKGLVTWNTEGPFQKNYHIAFYKIADSSSDAKVFETTYFINSDMATSQFDVKMFIYRCTNFESGSYYFTVQNLGDGIEYNNSDIISSKDVEGGTYEYIKPDSQLPTPAKGHWEWPAAIWDGTDGQQYTIEYGFSKTGEDEISSIGESFERVSGSEDRWLQEKLIGENGNGYYYFRVWAITDDITQQRNSEPSPWSDGYNLTEASEKLADKLGELNTDDATRESIAEGIGKLNPTELQNAMRADNPASDNGTVTALTALENKVGGPASVVVSDEMSGSFQEDAVKVVGASLNNKNKDDEGITLNIGRAEKKDISETLYNSTVAVNFSMGLDNVNDTENLAVPVKITFPIPSTINPKFLVVLHYHADGSNEEVLTNCYQNNGKWFVTFVLTSFSDFVLTERADGGGSGSEDPPVPPVDPIIPPFTGGGGSGIVVPDYSITVNNILNGSVTISAEKAKAGAVITLNVKPVNGYILDALDITDDSGKPVTVSGEGNVCTFVMPNANVTISASFVKIPVSMPFTDVADNAWYYDAVNYVCDKGIMNGTGDTVFSPDMTTTRGMVATLLYRLEGQPDAPSPGFTDVSDGLYYSKAIAWATVNGIVNGYGDGRFGPEDTITREQLAAVLYRYAAYKKYDVSSSAELTRFTDAENVSAYAKNAVGWAVATGLVNGIDSSTIAPQGNASRAQLASILMRFCESIVR